LDETINQYQQEKSGVAAACASPWVFTAHNHPPMHLTQCILCSKPTGEVLVGVPVLNRFGP
jgi:hypothetical protein